MLSHGDNAPDFTAHAVVRSASGEGFDQVELSLSKLLGESAKGLILYFYPRAMTPGCTKEACDFRDSLTVWQAAGYNVVGVSPDAPARLEKFAERDGLAFPLISDPEHEVMAAYGAWGEKKNYGKIVTGTIRSTFVINTDGVIDFAQYNVRAAGHVGRLRGQLGLD
ncbi:MAG: peroxiredoxin [Actinomycetaceae bacterium]|nr:peroxiredoxin [Actinomycetaceae bacterium]